MSSTARGTIRNDNDYYVTPHWLIREFLARFIPEYNINPKACNVLDPSAGGCAKYAMSYPTILEEFGFNSISTSDIRDDSLAMYTGVDYLNAQFLGNDLIITNPPFDCSTEFVEQALKQVNQNGTVVMLQRLNWLGSIKRKQFWDNAPLKQIYVHHKRASFYPELPNKKDSIEYAHFVFQKGYQGSVNLSII